MAPSDFITCRCQSCKAERPVEVTRESNGATAPGRRLGLVGPNGAQAHYWRDIKTAEPCRCGSYLAVLVYDMRPMFDE